ncbi:hypothetical protein BBJ28_00026704 [Nothophytophthora sp. Chile5]|nr:hypothetical protein BBJ28_00026704 [Nothophytophthora sp. Chile5]
MEVDVPSRYSVEMLASLRNEQNVLLSSKKSVEEVEEMELGSMPQQVNAREDALDVDMEDVMDVEQGNDEEAGRRVAMESEEEFIPLQAKMMKSRRTKNRVTFGVYSQGPNLSKAAEVIEEELSGDEDEEGDEPSRRWEEELMRRGGHRVAPSSQSTEKERRSGLPTYPTRRKVTCVSLSSILSKLEKNVESTAFEDDRASRELARLEAEMALVETALKQQREELLVSSEEFEYFQLVEDFVKGLSFCLREKVPEIEAKEKKSLAERVQMVEKNRNEEQRDVIEEVKVGLATGRLQEADVMGWSSLNLRSNGDEAVSVASPNDPLRAARLHRFQHHFTESYTPEAKHKTGEDEDLFADAIDEINSLDRVYGRFQEWKAKFPEVYKNSYCELAEEKLYAPYVRAELLSWDPLGVAGTLQTPGKTWSLEDFAWFRTLHQHLRQSNEVNGISNSIESPILHQIRDVLVEKAHVAVSSYFDPYSSLQARSLALLLDELSRHGYTRHVEGALLRLVTAALDVFSSEAKRVILLTVDQATATVCKDVSSVARYQLERFNALQDNLLTLFVAMPKGDIAAAGFRCLLQVFHQLLAYVRHCQQTHKTHVVSTATQVVAQLSGSSFLLQILTEPRQERELKHMMELFAPFLQTTP